MIPLLLALSASPASSRAASMTVLESRRDGLSIELTVSAPVFTARPEGVFYPEVAGFTLSMIDGDLLRPCLVFYVPLPPGADPVFEYDAEAGSATPSIPRGRPAVSPVLTGEGLSTAETFPAVPTSPPPPLFTVEPVRAMGVDLARVTFQPFDGRDYGSYVPRATLNLYWDAVEGAEPLSRTPLSLICPRGVLWWPPSGERSESPFWGLPWARVEVSRDGCHLLTGSMLDSAGVDVLGADPATLRMLTGPALQFTLEDAGETHSPDEVALLVLDGGDGSFDACDSIIFMGRPTCRFEPVADSSGFRLVRLSHRYDLRSTYWLTWGGEPGKRMEEVAARPDSSPQWPGSFLSGVFIELDTFWIPESEHRTGWVWTLLSSGFVSTFTFLSEQVGGPATLDVRLVSAGSAVDSCRCVLYLDTDSLTEVRMRGSGSHSLHLEPVTIREGTNSLRIRTMSGFSGRPYFDNLSVTYPRLPSDAGGVTLYAADAPSGRYSLRLGVEGEGPARVFNCSDHYGVVLLDGVEDSGGTVSLSMLLKEGTRIVAARPSDLMRPASIAPASPGRILGTLEGADAVIIAPDELLDAAAPLASMQEGDGLSVELVSLREVYDEFGQGVDDPGAVRAFIGHALDTWDPVPTDFILVGDGHYDPLNRNTPEQDMFPAWVRLRLNDCLDDLYAITTHGQNMPEASLSRIPADTPQDVSLYVSKVAMYRSGAASGTWNNDVLLVADDELGHTNYETTHTLFCEAMADSIIDKSFDRTKFYLIEYPWPAGERPEKPEAREDFVEALCHGWLAVIFYGHGSHDQICGEKLFVNSDIARVKNGPRQPLMIFASCDVGRFDRISVDCMGEEFVNSPGAGAILTVAATRGTGFTANVHLFTTMGSILLDSVSVPVGQALWATKMICSEYQGLRYILFGDGTIELARPERGTEAVVAGDTLFRGRSNRLTAAFPDERNARVRVAESGAWRQYTCLNGTTVIDYLKYGATAFEGRFPAPDGMLDVSFFMPLQSDTGMYGRASALGLESGGSGSDWLEWIPVVDSGGYASDSVGPIIRMGIEGCAGEPVVTGPDPVLEAELSDPSGICIFGGGAGRSILINLDSQAFDISRSFSYDHGSSTDGSLSYPLPHLLEGGHRVIMAVWDGIGNVSRDTLDFTVVEAVQTTLSEFVVYPNPSSGPLCFSFRSSTAGEATASIYTIAGRRIWEDSRNFEAGYCQMVWNGLDADGDAPASGAYIYLLRFEGEAGSDTERGVLGIVRGS